MTACSLDALDPGAAPDGSFGARRTVRVVQAERPRYTICGLRKKTVAGIRGNGRGAPKAPAHDAFSRMPVI